MFVKMSLQSRRDYLRVQQEQYLRKISREKKSDIVNEVVRITGFHRKYAIQVLNKTIPLAAKKSSRIRQPLYTEALPSIRVVWESLDYPCPERLHPVLCETADLLCKHGHLKLTPLIRKQLSDMSRATLGRRLTQWLHEKPKGSYTRSKGISRHKIDIPIKTYEWNETRPGALEIDLVEHNGGSSLGHFGYTLSVVDIVSGYSRRIAFLGRGQAVVFQAIQAIIEEWPMKPWGIHSDNGSEFLSDHLRRFCKEQGLEFTRSRPYKKNDNAHVEQKNKQYVREIVGYQRYDTPCDVTWLNEVYTCLDPYANLFLPMRKIISKERIGARVKKRYDTARTPFQRLIEMNVLSAETVMHVKANKNSLDPLGIHRHLEQLLHEGPKEVVLSDAST
jgi:hypothetical protein